MRTLSDWELIQRYAKSRSEPAFAELVRRHLAWVYSVARRQVRDPQLAEDVAQSVFVLLARKAGSLRSGTLLGGWLFRTTCFVASRALRAEQRLKHREQIASSMTAVVTLPEDPEAAWERLAPHLDQVVAALSEPDRAAVLLRFYEKKPFHEIGRRLGVSEEAAKKRVSRAVEKMRTLLMQRGVSLGGPALVAILTGKTVEAVPAALEASVLKAAAAGASASAVLPQLARETLSAWRWARVKLAAGLTTASMALLFVAVNAGGLFTRHAARQPVSENDAAQADTSMTAPVAQAVRASTLKARTQTARKTGAITGVVEDNEGHPISGAKVWSGHCERPSAQDTTDASGQFALDQVAGPAYVTVTADGFAADQQEFDPANAAGTLMFRLSPVRPLDVRLVDKSGQGVPGARLFLQEWWGKRGTLGQYLPGQTDADGRWQWLSAPKGELQVECVKAGYRYSRTNKFAADGEEHVIVLHPLASVSGSVTDAETGSSVASFKLTLGRSQPWNPDNPVPMWEFLSRAGSNGSYKVVIEEEQVPYLRIEADGYETVETVIQLTNAVEGARDFQLKRLSETNSIRGTVLLPDGSLAVGVEVALCTATVGVRLSGTAFEPGAFGNINRSQWPDYRRRTDEHGAFSFDPKPAAHTVVAVGPAGLGRVRCFDFSKPLEIRLQPWGRIEGNVRTRDGQWADRKLHWRPTGHSTRWQTLFCESDRSAARSDAVGRFTLEHIPPGGGWVAIDAGPGTAPILSSSLEVKPGTTVQAQIGGLGRPVTGRLVAPPGLEIRSWSNHVKSARVQADFEWDSYQMPRDLTGNAAERWRLEFADTEAGRTCSRSQYRYDFTVEADGAFTLPEVLPGRYWLFVNVGRGYLGSGSDSRARPPEDPLIAQVSMKFSVPAPTADGGAPLDLGEIVVTATR